MKRVKIISTGVMLAFMLTAITTYGQQTARDYQAQIEDLNKEMVKSMLSGDTESNLKMYTEDAISLPSYEPIREGKAEIRKAADEMIKSGFKITSFEPTTLKVIPEGNMITEIGTYKIKGTMSGTEVNDHGKYLTIWEKQPDGSLKIKVETWNSDINPMQQSDKN